MPRKLWLAAGVALAFASSAAAVARAQTYLVTANDVYIRAAPNGFAIGTLFQGNSFRRQQTGSLGY